MNKSNDAANQAVLIPLAKISAHPFNPRPFSEKYGWRVIDENVEALMHAIKTFGYDPSEPILVRDMGNGEYQCIKGHTRCVSMTQLGEKKILAYVRIMEDVEAAISLVTLQGASVDPWSKRQHAFECCQSFGHDNLLTVSDYADKINVARTTVSCWLKEYRVALNLIDADLISQNNLRQSLSAKTAYDISRLPDEDWVWFSTLLMENSWPEARRTQAIEAVIAIDETAFTPVHLEWINLNTWKLAAAMEAGDSGHTNALGMLQECMQVVDVAIAKLDDNRQVWVFDDQGNPVLQHWNLQEIFVKRLSELDSMSTFLINQTESFLYSEIQELDTDYQAFLDEHESKQQAKRRAEAERQRIVILQNKFAPQGVKEVTSVPLEVPLDCVFMNPGSVRMKYTDQNLILNATENLKDSGYLITFIYDPVSLFQWQSAIEFSSCMKFLELITWVKPGTAHLVKEGHFVNDVVFIHVATPTECNKPYFKPSDSNLKTSISFSDVIESEKLPWSKLQVPIEVANYLIELYTPPEATIYDCATACGTLSVCAKRSRRKAFYYTNNSTLFSRIQERLTASPFHETLILKDEFATV